MEFLSALKTPELVVFGLLLVLIVLLLLKNRKVSKLSTRTNAQKSQLSRKLFELQILGEVIPKISTSFGIREVLEDIIGSLSVVVNYTAASYIIFDGNKAIFKSHLREGVSKEYIEDIKAKMMESIKLVAPNSIGKRVSEESHSGHDLNDLSKATVVTYVNVPVCINNEYLGVFNVSSIKNTLVDPEDIKLLFRVITSACRNLTKIKELVEHEKDKLQVMVESMSEGVLMIDKSFRVLVINPACYTLMGRDPNFTINIFDVFDYFSGVFPLEEKIARVFATGKIESISELKIGDKYYEVIVIPVRNKDEIIGVGILIRDQSKEMELKKLRQDFTAMMVHELRSPLSVIKGTSDLLIKEFANLKPEQISMFMTQIKDSSVALLGIVNQLLDASKIESGKIELFKKVSDINQILTDEFNYYYNLARDKGINFSFDLDLSIQKFYFDEQKIKQVMNNLLSNSIKFTDGGGNIVIISKNYGSYVSVTVQDTGKGVPDEMKEKLFQKFVQGRESDRSNEAGTGLGLVISKGIVDAHGGRIWIEDNASKGAKFIFTLPIQ